VPISCTGEKRSLLMVAVMAGGYWLVGVLNTSRVVMHVTSVLLPFCIPALRIQCYDVAMKQLWQHFSRYKLMFGLTILILGVEAGCDLLQPTLMAGIIDHGVGVRNLDFVLQQSLIMLSVTALGALAALGRNYFASTVSQRFGAGLRSALFRHIQDFSAANVDTFQAASLITRVSNDVGNLQNFVNGIMRIFVKAPMIGIGGMVMAMLVNPGLSLILLCTVPVVGLVIFVSMRRSYPFFMQVQEMVDRLNGVSREYLAGVRVVKAFSRQEHEEGRFARVNQALAKVSMQAMRVMAGFGPLIGLIFSLGVIAVIWLGAYRIDEGGMQIGQLIAFLQYLSQILFALMLVSNIFMNLVKARVSAERLEAVLQEKPAIVDSAPALSATRASREAPAGKGATLAFEQVSFAYPGSTQPVLAELSFGCPAGGSLGIIGPTGAGKTTLALLIARFYEASSGVVTMDGVPVQARKLEDLRAHLALVPQKSLLFTGTIAENLRWGKPDATDSELSGVCKAAQADEFIRGLPLGYESRLGKGGLTLSGGQKQRLAIARALLRQPSLLILDDSLSALDMETERHVTQALKEQHAGMTRLIIAQRLVSVMHCDNILVLDRGRLVESGSHAQLMRRKGMYHDIHESQIGRELS